MDSRGLLRTFHTSFAVVPPLDSSFTVPPATLKVKALKGIKDHGLG